MKNLKNKGFSLIELLFVMVIIVIISTVAMPKLIDFQKEQSLRNTTENIMALLNKAKSDSSSSLNSNNYGIHFNNDNMVYFIGGTFSSSNTTNKIFDFDPGVEVLSLNLNGGGSDIIFPRLTGDTIGYGSITIQITAKPSRQKVITISKTGSISSD